MTSKTLGASAPLEEVTGEVKEYIVEVTSETHDMEDRFNYYRQGSKYRLFYNGNSLYTQWFIVAGSGIYICAIPFIEGYVENDDGCLPTKS